MANIRWDEVKGSFPMRFWRVGSFVAGRSGTVNDLQDGDCLVFYEFTTSGSVELRVARHRPSPTGHSEVPDWATNCDFTEGDTAVLKGDYRGNQLTVTMKRAGGRIVHSGEVHNEASHRHGGGAARDDEPDTDGATWHGDEGP